MARYQYWEPFTPDQAFSYIMKYRDSQLGIPGEWFQLGIANKESARLIGDCALKLDGVDPRNAEVGCNLSCSFQKRGMATETLHRLYSFDFLELGVHRITAIADCENISSIKLLERMAMRCEGHFEKNVWFKGTRGSEYSYAILDNEFLQEERS